jgi:hypothetical protein
MPDDQKPHSFWTSLPGVLTGIAALLTAIAGFVIVFKPSPPKYTPPPVAVVAPPPVGVPPAAPPVGPPPARMGELVDGLAYLQADIYSQASNSAADCAEVCRSDSRCQAMTFIKSQRLCWIKGSVPATAPSSDMVSAAKLKQ